MNHWSREHRSKRHSVQRSFEALVHRDARALQRWCEEVGILAMLEEALAGPRAPFVAAATGAAGPDLARLVMGWSTRFAERVHQGWAPPFVLDWWLERPRVWVEGEVRQKFGAGMLKSLRAGFVRGAGHEPDALALDAVFTAAVVAALDAAESFTADEPVAPWLRGISFHVGRDFARAEERRILRLPRADLDPDAVPSSATDELAQVDLMDQRDWIVARALSGAALSGEEVIVASILEGQRSAESIGAELSISVKRVYKRTAAARARLREAMDRLQRR